MAELIATTPLLKLAVLAALFVLVAGITYMATGMVSARQVARQRLLASGTPIDDSTRLVPTLRNDQTNAAWLRLVNQIEKSGLSLVDTKDESLRRRLAAAGYTATYAPRVYTLVRLGLVIGLPMLAGFLFWLSGSAPGLIKLWFTLMITAAMGLYFPSLIIRVRADQRERQIINGFPDALDLMLVCVEAGLALESAFDRVGKEVTLTHPLLAEQIGTVVLELRAGRSREDALRRLADRTGADEIRAFATLLIQSTNLGTSIATTLRVYASEMRERRRMRAEEKAHRLPVLLSIPLVVCMLPVMIGVLMLPAVIRVVRILIPSLHGGG
ncbi:MAG TPA: type II secretion system F family protein [Sphingomicrobium sp.]|jgi:tight adherence protein C|nr:type II secretion system F family protein [Sphingomicrobium sp.]